MVDSAARYTRPARGPDDGRPRLNQSVRISPDLRARLRMWAAYQEKEISTVVEEAVATHLDALDRDRAAHGLDPMPCPGASPEAPPGKRPGGKGGATWPSQR